MDRRITKDHIRRLVAILGQSAYYLFVFGWHLVKRKNQTINRADRYAGKTLYR